MQKKRLIFMGTPPFSATILEGLIENGYNVVAVVTQSDKKVGRKKELQFSAVKAKALAYNIPVLQPINIKVDYQAILSFDPECIITCAYGQIIPKEILNYPKHKCINIHASLLPKYRGGAPIHKAIMNGDTKTGITIMEMVEKMDAGPICYVKEYPISYSITTSQLFLELAIVGKQAILECLPLILSDQIKFTFQNEQEVTYAYTIKKEDEQIDLSLPGITVYNHIRGLLDVPGAYIVLKGKKIKLFNVDFIQQKHTDYGKISFEDQVFKFYLDGGILTVQQLQMEGKTKVDATAFYNGIGRQFTTFIG